MAEITITKSNFEDEVIKSDIPVLIDFWAPWCGPCQMLSPVIEEISNEYDGIIKVGKINVDDEVELSYLYKVVSIPTLILFKNGKEEGKLIGYNSKEDIVALFNK